MYGFDYQRGKVLRLEVFAGIQIARGLFLCRVAKFESGKDGGFLH